MIEITFTKVTPGRANIFREIYYSIHQDLYFYHFWVSNFELYFLKANLFFDADFIKVWISSNFSTISLREPVMSASFVLLVHVLHRIFSYLLKYRWDLEYCCYPLVLIDWCILKQNCDSRSSEKEDGFSFNLIELRHLSICIF